MINCVFCNNVCQYSLLTSSKYSFYRCEECDFVITTLDNQIDYCQFKTILYIVRIDIAFNETVIFTRLNRINYIFPYICYFDVTKSIEAQIEDCLLLM